MSRALAGDLGTTPAARISLGAGAVFGVVLAACSLGVGLAAIGVAMGPLGVVVPAVLVVAGIAAFDSPARAMVIAFFSFPIGLVHLPLGLQAVEAAVLIASMLVIVRRLAAGASPLPWTPEMWWPLALFGLMIISTPGALDPGLAIKQVTLLAAAMILALAITAACRTIDDTRR